MVTQGVCTRGRQIDSSDMGLALSSLMTRDVMPEVAPHHTAVQPYSGYSRTAVVPDTGHGDCDIRNIVGWL